MIQTGLFQISFGRVASVAALAVLLGACQSAPAKPAAVAAPAAPSTAAKPVSPFAEVMVHDPSVIKVGGTWYVFGSHLQSAKTNDLMRWTQISTGPEAGNKLIPNVSVEMAEALKWAQSNTFWAPDVIKLRADGKYYMYYCACKGDSPVSALGLAVSDKIEGPYKNKGLILKSGMFGEESADGTGYDSGVHPNAVDPNVFYDPAGNLWMVYGSYSGGIFVLSLDPKTGLPFPNQGFGKKVAGGYNVRMEAPYILYNADTQYYYLFLSFGGLGADGAYNMRVARSKAPNGPYLDPAGADMLEARGMITSVFDDDAIAPYGEKLFGNYQFKKAKGEKGPKATGYLSSGHNSALYDTELKKYLLFFHTRFEGRGEQHQVRVHQFFFSADGWPVVSPFRYSGETIGTYTADEVAGGYKFINHGHDITADVKRAVALSLEADGTVTGAATGTWKLVGANGAELTLDGVVYQGVFTKQLETDDKRETMTFTAVSNTGVSVWGSRNP